MRIVTGVLLFVSLIGFAQGAIGETITYISPKDGATLVSLQSNIIIRADDRIDPATVTEDVITVRGDVSGVHRSQPGCRMTVRRWCSYRCRRSHRMNVSP